MWWLLSPYSVTGGLAQVFGVYGSNFPGYLAADDSVLYANGVRPVISLNSNVKYLSGDGSPENPYEIETK